MLDALYDQNEINAMAPASKVLLIRRMLAIMKEAVELKFLRYLDIEHRKIDLRDYQKYTGVRAVAMIQYALKSLITTLTMYVGFSAC